MNGQPEMTDPSEQMRQESASTSGSASAEPEMRKQCVACRELILPSAKICFHCRSSQARRWAEVGAVLKWVGGITAVISLLLSTWQLRDLFRVSREKAAAVAELVHAADIRRETVRDGDALAFIDEALKLEPGSRYAREQQVTIAMDLIRNVGSLTGSSSEKLLRDTLPILYRGAAQADNQRAADALAHLGWVYHLFGGSGTYVGPIPEDLFRKALKGDPHNPFAHSFLADHCLGYGTGRTGGSGGEGCMSAEDASAHYTEALMSGREKNVVYGRILGFLCTHELEDLFRHCERLFQEMKRDSYVPTEEQREMVYGGIYDVFLREKAFTALLAQNNGEKIVNAIEWIAATEPGQTQREGNPYYIRKMWSPRLKELLGDTQAALAEYEALRLEARKWKGQNPINTVEIFPAIDEAVSRLIGFQRGRLGVELEELGEADWLGSPGAARVREVDPGSPAEKAGILPGDILLSVDGEDWGSIKGKFIVGTAPGGKAMELGVLRGEERLRIYAQLGAVPIAVSDWREWLVPVMIDHKLYGPGTWPLPEYGVTLAELTEKLRKGYSIPDDVRGVLILNNEHERETFAAGDVVSEIERQPITRPDELINALQTGSAAHKSFLQVTRVRNGAKTAETWHLTPNYSYDLTIFQSRF